MQVLEYHIRDTSIKQAASEKAKRLQIPGISTKKKKFQGPGVKKYYSLFPLSARLTKFAGCCISPILVFVDLIVDGNRSKSIKVDNHKKLYDRSDICRLISIEFDNDRFLSTMGSKCSTCYFPLLLPHLTWDM